MLAKWINILFLMYYTDFFSALYALTYLFYLTYKAVKMKIVNN
jgi:hypothetical protein